LRRGCENLGERKKKKKKSSEKEDTPARRLLNKDFGGLLCWSRKCHWTKKMGRGTIIMAHSVTASPERLGKEGTDFGKKPWS